MLPKNPPKPIKCYTDYHVENMNEGQYRIRIVYFVNRGNPITEFDRKQTMQIVCSAEKLKKKVTQIENGIKRTRVYLEREYRRIGASEQNMRVEMNKKAR